MTDNIKLPPLPKGEYRLSPDSRAPTLYDEEAMEAYARAAVEADRQRRGEPAERKRRYAQGTALGEFGIIPMCDQVDAEPVKVPSKDLAHEIWAAAQTAPRRGD